MVETAFEKLDEYDVVIGPARDGGYYLLGSKKLIPEFFSNKSWSTSNVFLDTLIDVQQLGLSYFTLPELNDVDEESDLPEELKRHAK